MIGNLKKSEKRVVKGYYFKIGEAEIEVIEFLKKNNFNISEVLRLQLKNFVEELNEKENQSEIKKTY